MLSALELAVLGLAASRVTQFIVHDSLLDGWRSRLELWHAARHTSRTRTFVRDLLSCVLCTGFHASWLTVLTYTLATSQWHHGVDGFLLFGIESFAVAAVQVTVNLKWDR